MAEPFERRATSGAGVWGRLAGKARRGGALREIEELLARAARVRDVAPARVAQVARQHGVDLERRLRTGRLGLYRRFFEHCLRDQSVSDAEREDLAHLRKLLFLLDADVARVHEDVSQAVYGQAIDAVLTDQRLDPEEEQFLRKLRDELRLPEAMAEQLYQAGSDRARRRYLEGAIRRDDFLLTSRDVTLELAGDAPGGIAEAVAGAVEQASRALDGLHWVEVTHIGAEVDEGRVVRWHVKLQAKRTAE